MGISGDRTFSLVDHLHEAGKTPWFNLVCSEHHLSELLPTASSCPLLHCRVPGFILSALEGSKIPLNYFSWGWISPGPSFSPHRKKNAPALNNPGGPLLSSLELESFLYWGYKNGWIIKVYDFKYFCLKSTFSATRQSSIFQFFAHSTRVDLHSTNKSMPKMPPYLFLIKSILYKSVCGKRHCVPQPLVNFSCIQTTIYDLKAFSTELSTTKLGIKRSN